MKFCLKLERNVNQFSTDINKISYKISWLKENAAVTIDFFYWNDILINLNILIKLLKMIYNDISQKYTVLIRLKTCWQTNHEFISFYSEFLALMNELNWNKDIKIAALQRTIFNEIWSQLMSRNMSSILTKFVILCQWINEDLHLNQVSWYKQLNAQWISWFIILIFLNSFVSVHNFMNIDATHTQYASVRSDEQKTYLTKSECFNCD